MDGATDGGTDMAMLGIGDLESLRQARLDGAGRRELLDSQRECTFVFSNDEGWPSGVVMNYLHIDGTFWLTAVEGRAHVRALGAEPRVTIVVSRAGSKLPGRRMVAFRGRATVHRDLQGQGWLLDAFAQHFRPHAPSAFVRCWTAPTEWLSRCSRSRSP